MSDRGRPASTGGAAPTGNEHVPEHVLDELLAAFNQPERDISNVDFDDPSIDRLLGITPPGGARAARRADASPDDDAGEDEITDDDDADDVVDLSIGVIIEPQPEPEPEPEPEQHVGSAPAEPVVARPTIVIGGGEVDELPDAVYLDEEGERRLRATHGGSNDDERNTIVIADLDESGSIEQLPARSSGAMDPRVRARRIAVRRAEGRRRLIWVAVAAAIVLVIVGVIAVFASSLFDVTEIRVQGAVYTDPALLAEVESDVRGDATLLVDTRALERKLETSPWVEAARVTTDFPHTVTIDVRERVPVAAFAGSDGKFRVIDADGRVLDVLAGLPVDYMLITGDNPDTERGQFAGSLYASAAQLVKALPSEIRSITKSVGVDTSTNELSITLDRPGAPDNDEGIHVRLGTADGLPAKLATLLQKVRNGLGDGEPIDVSTSEMSESG